MAGPADQWAQWSGGNLNIQRVVWRRNRSILASYFTRLGFLKSSYLQQKENGHIEGKKLSGRFAVASLARTYGSFWEFQCVRARKDLERHWSKPILRDFTMVAIGLSRAGGMMEKWLEKRWHSCPSLTLFISDIDLGICRYHKGSLHHGQVHFSPILFPSPYSPTPACCYSFLDFL